VVPETTTATAAPTSRFAPHRDVVSQKLRLRNQTMLVSGRGRPASAEGDGDGKTDGDLPSVERLVYIRNSTTGLRRPSPGDATDLPLSKP
jgi:hypothetical protein